MKDTVTISGRDNPLVKLVCRLQSSSQSRRESGMFVIEGARLCDDAAQNGIRFVKLLFTQGFREKNRELIRSFLDNSDESFELTDSLFNKVSDTETPQGIMALCRIPQQSGPRLIKTGRYIALENVADPSNLGAICRSAEALGINGIIVSSNGCDPYSPKSLRASMGTVLRIPVYITPDFTSVIRESGLVSYACVLDRNAEKLGTFTFPAGSVALVGNEANGLTQETIAVCEHRITIPMRGRVESLNASVAAALVMWEMVK